MKEVRYNGKGFKVIWKGIQNSKTKPLTVVCERDITPTYTEDAPYGTLVFKGNVKVQPDTADWKTKHIVVALPDDNADTYVICISEDVEIVSGDAGIYTWNTGGYKNTGSQAIIRTTPGTIIKVWGYNRRSYYYITLTNDGKIEHVRDVEVIENEDEMVSL